MCLSNINKSVTLEYLTGPESLYFDRKSAKYALKDLADEIASFANANGGIVAVGITNDGKIEGFNKYGADKLNEVQKVVTNFLTPTPRYQCEIIKVKNEKQEDDNIILFHIEPSNNYVIRNTKDEVYCRQGDSSFKLNHEQIRSLEYDRKERNFETEILIDSTIEDIDDEVVEIYKKKIDTDIDNISVLKARGFLKDYNNELKFTNAGMLLFGKNPSLYLPCARIRVFKFEGNEFKLGEKMNIIKENVFDKNIYRNLDECRIFINNQLRDFVSLKDSGIFEKIPEYPEFAWYEGIVNAVTHRDYTNSGEQILIKIFNNRMEILSPGKLGGFVTIDNITKKRYSRNPIMARTLVEFGIVRELNEGVKRIFATMKENNLNPPKYEEPGFNSVLLTLENNIMDRLTSIENITNIQDIWNDLNDYEKKIMIYLFDNVEATREEIEELIKRKRTTTTKILNGLVEKELIVWNGLSKYDKLGKYIIK